MSRINVSTKNTIPAYIKVQSRAVPSDTMSGYKYHVTESSRHHRSDHTTYPHPRQHALQAAYCYLPNSIVLSLIS